MANYKTVNRYIVFGNGTIRPRELSDAINSVVDSSKSAFNTLLLVIDPSSQFATYRDILDEDLWDDSVSVFTEDMTPDFNFTTGDIAEMSSGVEIAQVSPLVSGGAPYVNNFSDYDLDGKDSYDSITAMVLLNSSDGVDESKVTLDSLATLRERYPEVKVVGLNRQLVEIQIVPEDERERITKSERVLKSDKTPKRDDPPNSDVSIPSVDELSAMSRNDIKSLAKTLGVAPTDWRSKDSIIEAIIGGPVSAAEADVAPDTVPDITPVGRVVEEDDENSIFKSDAAELIKDLGEGLTEIKRSVDNEDEDENAPAVNEPRAKDSGTSAVRQSGQCHSGQVHVSTATTTLHREGLGNVVIEIRWTTEGNTQLDLRAILDMVRLSYT